MNPRLALLVLVLLLPLASAHAQSSGEEIEIIQAEQLLESVKTPAGQAPLPLKDKVLSDRGHYRYLVVQRTESGVPEVHAAWSDVTVIREGSCTLIYAGSVEGGQETAPGEVRGGRIVGGKRRQLAAGDVVIVPPGIPHQMVLEPGESVIYTVVKVGEPGGKQ